MSWITTTDSASQLLRSQLLKKPNNRFNPAIKIRNMEFLVRRVQIVVGQSEAHHHAGNMQVLLDVGDNGNRSAAAHEDGLLAEDLLHCFLRSLNVRVVGAD